MATTFQRSIFAYELEKILQNHGSSIAALKNKPFNFEWRRIERLLTSLTNPQPLPPLSLDEIISIMIKLKLSDQEAQFILAALFALQVQSFLLGWVKSFWRDGPRLEEEERHLAEQAWRIADAVRLSFIEVQKRNPQLTVSLLRRVPTLSEVPQMDIDQEQDIDQALARALDDYDTGMGYVTLGRLTNNAEEAHLLAEQGYLHLKRADRQLALLAERAGEHDHFAEWHHDVQKDLLDLEEELEEE